MKGAPFSLFTALVLNWTVWGVCERESFRNACFLEEKSSKGIS